MTLVIKYCFVKSQGPILKYILIGSTYWWTYWESFMICCYLLCLKWWIISYQSKWQLKTLTGVQICWNKTLKNVVMWNWVEEKVMKMVLVRRKDWDMIYWLIYDWNTIEAAACFRITHGVGFKFIQCPMVLYKLKQVHIWCRLNRYAATLFQ